MKSQLLRLIQLATNGVGLMLLLLALAAAITSIPAHAQDAWKADGEHSIARLSLGSGANTVEIGLARVSGHVVYGADDPADPVVDLNIKPENRQGADYFEIDFKSKRSMLTNDGKVAVVGDLTLTRLERSVTLDANEGYSGAVYGEPVVQIVTREVTLLLPAERPAVQNGTMELPASTTITREYFPQLLSGLAPDSWPTTVVEDETCNMPSGLPSEDYSGAACAGNTVATKTNIAATGAPASGEGYYGFEPAVIPDGGQLGIALDLRLTPSAGAQSGVSAITAAAGN
jgi:hypothetical protein